MDNLKFIRKWLGENRTLFHEAADSLWSNPELSLEEHKSSALHKSLLEKAGFRIEEAPGGLPTAFIARSGTGKPEIGFNCEYDALPGLSQKAGLARPEAVEGRDTGQGCGHNLLGTAAVKAAIALSARLKETGSQGSVTVFGSPAEELCIGKPLAARDGHYRGIDAFLDWHPWSYNRADYDTCNAYFSVKYRFKGQTAHGNAPWMGRSALDGAILAGHAIEMMREHYPSAPEDAANTLNYTFSDTGPAFPSVVPDHAELWCIGRFGTAELSRSIMERLDRAVEGCAMATSTEVSRELITATHEKIPNKILAQLVHEMLTECGLPEYTEEDESLIREMQRFRGIEERGMDREIKEFGTSGTALCDTSEFSWHAPYATFWLAMAPHDGWHNWMVTSCAGSSIGLKCMDKAAEILACSAMKLMENPELLAKAKEEWTRRMNGRSYSSLLSEPL